MTIELIGDAVNKLDPNLVRQAAAAVLHYFKTELQQEVVTIREFTAALERVLRKLGLKVVSNENARKVGKIIEADLIDLVADEGAASELLFFQRLRDNFADLLEESPHLVRLNGLRPCVKSLVGKQRWCKRCVKMSDQIIEFLRDYLDQRKASMETALVVS
ncbi:MAG: hypothetical protein CMO80_17970 [Verrucomicrobiales bacterium]|nr:hypothetical protein [Verrucomicrobiales bacterium]